MYWRARHGLALKARPPLTPTTANAGAFGSGPPHCGNAMSKPCNGGAARVVAVGARFTVNCLYHQPLAGEWAYTDRTLLPGSNSFVGTIAVHPDLTQSG